MTLVRLTSVLAGSLFFSCILRGFKHVQNRCQAKVVTGVGGAATGHGMRHLPPWDAAPQAGGQTAGPPQPL